MFAPFQFRRSSSALAAMAFGVLVTWVGSGAARAADPPDVRGVIATRITFGKDASERLSIACCELLAHCTFRQSTSEAEWNQTFHQCHLSFTFATPRAISVDAAVGNDREKIEVDQMVVTYPLSAGRVWVRSGDKYLWFAKWPAQQSVRLGNAIQTLLSEAMPRTDENR